MLAAKPRVFDRRFSAPGWDWFWQSRRLSLLCNEGGGEPKDAIERGLTTGVGGVPTWAAGPHVDFDGVDDFYSVASHTRLDVANNVTVIIRVRFDAASSGFDGLFARRQASANTNYAMNFNTTGNLQWYYHSGVDFRILTADFATFFSIGVWYTLVGVFRQNATGTDAFLYRDGVLIASDTTPLENNVAGIAEPLHLGSTNVADGEHSNISIDCFHLLDRAINADQVAQLLDPWAPFRMAPRRIGGAPAAGDITITPNPVAASFSVPAPTVTAGGIVLLPDAVVASLAVPAPTVTVGGVILTPASVAAVMSVGVPTIVVGGTTLTPTAVVAALAVGLPTVVPGGITITPAAVAAALAVAVPSVTIGGQTITPDAVAAALNVAVPSLVMGGVTLTPDAVVAALAVGIPSLNVGGVTLTPDAVAATLAIGLPNIVVGGIVLTPDAAQAVFGVAAPTLVEGPVTISPSPVVGRFIIATPTVILEGEATVVSGRVVAFANITRIGTVS